MENKGERGDGGELWRVGDGGEMHTCVPRSLRKGREEVLWQREGEASNPSVCFLLGCYCRFLVVESGCIEVL